MGAYLEEKVEFLFRIWVQKRESTRSAKCWAETLGDSLLEEIIEPLFEFLTAKSAQKIVDVRAGMGMRERANNLAEKLKQASLSDDERSANERYLSAFHFVKVIQTRARRLLKPVNDD